MDTKRMFDLLCAVAGICCLLPFFLVVIILLKIDSAGPVFYKQVRICRNLKKFHLIKFRTMYVNADRAGLLTIGDHDPRITRVGTWLRKYKIDELPQLFNILKGDMSFVGPRPEVLKYVELYDARQQRILSLKPGLTDWASIQYINESELLAGAEKPEDFYIHTVMPAKIRLNLEYLEHHDLRTDLKIIFCTFRQLFRVHQTHQVK